MSLQINPQFSSDSEKTSASDSEIQVFLNFGFFTKANLGYEIALELNDNEILDTGLVIGLKQFDNIVDINFIGNKDVDDIIFHNEYILANGKSYKYDKVKIRFSFGECFLVSKDQHEFILKMNEEIFEMLSVIINDQEEENCVISVINSQICSCEISNGQIISVNPIDIGENKIIDDNLKIRTKSGTEFNISDCYLRRCKKKIYLHIDDNPSGTLILGKTDSSSSLNELDI